MNGTTLEAECRDFFGNFVKTSLANAASCKDIEDVDGALRCVVSKKDAPSSTGVQFYDIISIPQDSTTNGVETKVIRIDHPKVWSSTNQVNDNYLEITFKPGDMISFNSGGCVQTGGSGKTWKSYNNPQGSDAGALYSGTVWIPSVTGGGFQRIAGIMSDSPWTVPEISDPDMLKALTLRLDYQDDNLSDNGYYSHDDGNYNQCANTGPAWVEVTVVSGGTAPLGVVLSPHSKPFDLVWDINAEDFNGLPLNPLWAWQLDNPAQQDKPRDQPDFDAMCDGAFPGTDEMNTTILAQTCTSQNPYTDTHYVFFTGCSGYPLQGHLDWAIATYMGPITWDSVSPYLQFDCDYNFNFLPPSNNGLARGGPPPNPPKPTMEVEFDPREVTANMGSPWWQDTKYHYPPGNAAQPTVDQAKMESLFHNNDGGLFVVLTGLIGLDAVHGSYTESHPVFAMALRVSSVTTPATASAPETVKERWAFFLRNLGNEGGCGSNMHLWDSATGDYFIQLPRPSGATKMANAATVTPWNNAKVDVSFHQGDIHWTVIKVHGDGQFGVDGDVTLTYTISGTHPPKKPDAVPAGEKPKIETEEADLASRISDPATRAKFQAALNAIQPSTKIATPAAPLTVSNKVTVLPHAPGAASKGQLVRSRTTPNVARQQFDVKLVSLVETYQTELKADPAELQAVKAKVLAVQSPAQPVAQPTESIKQVAAPAAATTPAAK